MAPPSPPRSREKPGFSTWDGEIPRDTDSPLEEAVCCEPVSEMELGKSGFGGSDGKIWRRGTTCNRLDRPTAWGKGPFCRLSKERGGSTRSKFVQYGRLFSQLRFKAHNIGALATTINRGYCGRHTL
jgi:hypothetical protein